MAYTEKNGASAVKASEATLKVVHQIETAGLPGSQQLVFDYSGDSAYTDTVSHTVVIGVPFVYRIHQNWIHDDADMLSAVEWIRKHEVCHIRYTGGRSYAWAINAGILEIYKYIAAKNSTPIIFRSDRDKTVFETQLRKEYGQVFIDVITQIAANIANSLEDGRIERIQTAKQPGFGKMRIFYRGTCFWNSSAEDDKPVNWNELRANPGEHLTVLMNAVLLLATTQMYPKNFVKRYGKTPIFDEMKPIIPLVAQGYLAKNTHDMGEAAQAICRKLAPLIYETAQAAANQQKGVKEAAEELLKQLLTSIADSPSFSSDSDMTAEDDDTDSMNTMLPNSDLTITLPDETYDKLMEKMKKKEGGSGSGITILREHPKEEENYDSDSSSGSNSNGSQNSGSSSSSVSNSDSSSSADSSSSETSGNASDTADSGKNGSESNASGSNASNSDKAEESKDSSASSVSTETSSERERSSDKNENTGLSSDGQQGSRASGNASAGSTSPADKNGRGSTEDSSSADESNAGSQTDTAGLTGDSGSTSTHSKDSNCKPADIRTDEDELGYNGSASVPEEHTSTSPAVQKKDDGTTDADLEHQGENYDEIETLMKQAAEAVHESSDETLENINKSSISRNTAKRKMLVVKDAEKPISQGEIRSICSNFKEHKHAYKVDLPLPAELQAKGNAMHRKIENYFKSMKQPTARYRRSGILDKSRIAKIATNHTDIFAKKGKSKNADGAVYILIDNSGSMMGEKRTAACSAAAIIEEGFRGLMPIKIVAFDSWGSINHEVVKNWNESLPNNCCWNFCRHGKDGGGNDDQYDIAIASYELQKRPEFKKILIVLSDGAPSSVSGTSAAIDDARRHGIQVAGIYFEEGEIDPEGYASEFIRMYKKDYVCCGTDQIAENLCRIMEKFAHNK